MTIDALLDALAASETPTRATLAAAVAEAPALAPAIAGLAREVGDGIMLVPRQERLLSRGLRVLAEARRTEIHAPLLAMLSQPEDVLRRILGFEPTDVGKPLLLATFDGDVAPLLAIVRRRLLDGMALRAVLHVLARLAFDGAWPREHARALLDEFDTERLADDGDLAWLGWQDAVALLGFADMADRVATSFRDGRVPGDQDAEDAWNEMMRVTLAAPHDPARFEALGLRTLDDAAAAIARDQPPEHGVDERSDGRPDAAAGVALSRDEIDWLDCFLLSRHVPETAASIEELDGLFCALVAGPEPVPPAEWMAALLGDGETMEPDYADAEQAAHVRSLLDRHMRAIALRLAAGQPHLPLLEERTEDETALDWALGFGAGIGLRLDAWNPLLEHRRHGELPAAILALGIDESVVDEEPLVGREREELIEDLPWMLLAIYRHWHRLPARARTTKVGRNEPCPCGSGRKFKFCCGSAAGPAATG
ncbi:MAG: UPF0149 family protein [Alphaproteobacteria bacterium]|nr:UPF0149 family protein [Alphaproteobacteria bacterium]